MGQDATDVTKSKGKYRYLAGNIALFSVSNFVSKILVFLLVPLYTGVLSTYEYGVADILQVTILLLVPALTVNMGEAALRFGLEETKKRGSILRCGLTAVARADAIALALAVIVMIFAPDEIKMYAFYFALMFAANSLYEYLILYFQGSELVPIVVIGSVCSTVIMIACNLIFLLVIKTGLSGYIFSQVIAYAFAAGLMLLLARPVLKEASFEKDDALKAEMTAYGRPMLAYSTASWVNNAADRYIVAALCGAAVNGIYGVAYKIPAILMVFQRVFAQAWQMSATKSHNEGEGGEFFSSMYNAYNVVMVVGCGILIFIVRPLSYVLFQKDFFEAWKFVPPLLISVIFGALTGFLGSICLAHKDSKSMGIATGIGAIANVILNFASIPRFGAMGAAWATAFSYFLMSVMALKFVEKHEDIKRNAPRDYISYVLLVAEAVVMIVGGKYSIWICSTILVIVLAMYFAEIYAIVIKLLNMLKNRKNKEAA